MPILLPKSIFFHVPRTGGTWLTTFLRQNFNCCSIINKHTTPRTVRVKLGRLGLGKRRRFAFVRNPIYWYISRFTSETHNHRLMGNMQGTYTQLNPIFNLDALDQQETFPQWIERILSEHPSWLSWYYEWFLGKNYSFVAHVGRYESMVEDLQYIFDMAGENYGDLFDKMAESYNPSVARSQKSECLYPKKLLKKLIEQEQAIFTRFDYSTDLKDYAGVL